eukprot:TRINITY_DN7281_c0_g2_i11.p1 TRINITY_DN7281_c0_g2~~TRINITY_DN7281_c0_g2_i11.p1  ORF type:complete len:532 (-),score=76.87 TRINITY_DN7281_c0_g2_i11:2360-3955(-)
MGHVLCSCRGRQAVIVPMREIEKSQTPEKRDKQKVRFENQSPNDVHDKGLYVQDNEKDDHRSKQISEYSTTKIPDNQIAEGEHNNISHPFTSYIPDAKYSNPENWRKVIENHIIRIFLSSTFRDMQRERDAFFRYGEPRLREWAKKKGLALHFIDLRWGLTMEASSNGEVTIRCYESIEQCPYFLCTLGSRYGWIPDHSKPSEWHPSTDNRFPFLKEYEILSVTHYEIIYGAMKNNPIARRAFFYERDEAYVLKNTPNLTEKEVILYQPVDEKDRENQNAMKQEIRRHFNVPVYFDARQLSDMIAKDLLAVMEVDFASVKLISEDEDQAHSQMMRHRLDGFEGRAEVLQKLVQNVNQQLETENGDIIGIGAESGVGKSSMIAALARELSKDSHLNVFYHFVGCSNQSQYVESLNMRLYEFLHNNHIFDKGINTDEAKVIVRMGLFEILDQDAFENCHGLVILLDAVNQLVDSHDHPQVQQLNWLPKKLPKNVAMIVSTTNAHPSHQVDGYSKQLIVGNNAYLKIVVMTQMF